MGRTESSTLRRPDARLLESLEAAAPGGVHARATDRLAMAHDASHYLLKPDAVVAPKDAAQVAALLRASAHTGFSLTFRSGGTSLSGQAGSGSVLVDTRRHFRDVDVLGDGERVRVQPGATVRQINARLSAHGTKLGPDPASEAACTIGGVVANNSSGMACGTEFNSYRTLESAVLVLPSGTVLDTSDADADSRLRLQEPALHAGLLALRDRVRGNPESCRTIRRQFAMKNTMGYGLNAFLDHSSAVDILLRLVVGSEGTLAFLAEATFRTVPVKPHAATGLLVFPDLRHANEALPALVSHGLATIELLDAASLRVARVSGLPQEIERQAALLVEHQELTAESLAARVAATSRLLADLPLSLPGRLTEDPRTRAELWHIRKGLYAAVAGARPAGTTALLEDIAVPVDALARTCEHLLELFDRHAYDGSVVFGHAKDGNLHFLLGESFDHTDRYLAFTEDLVDLVLGESGTLKAEHGTGRIMAPFVRRQYGDELYAVMCELKALVDPHGLLNPGVVLNDDPLAHIRHLKGTVAVEEEVDRCVECGYCEPVCPSKDLTLTPRQRIVLRREQAQAVHAGDTALVEQLEQEYAYDGVQTCAVDGMCETACPVHINTGDLVRRLRAEDAGPIERRFWTAAAGHWGAGTHAAATALTLAGALPPAVPAAATKAARAMLGPERVPAWSRDLPRGGTRRLPRASSQPVAVLLPSCTGTMFGAAEGTQGAHDALLALCSRAQVEFTVPARVEALCCGTPWTSKGMVDGLSRMKDLVLPALQAATDGGRLPVVCDATSCTEGLTKLVQSAGGVAVVDAVTFTARTLLPRLTVTDRLASVALHPTCAAARLGITPDLLSLAQAIAVSVLVPDDWGCCGFAGDRGLLHPELTAAATARQAREVSCSEAKHHASANRTCELAMTRATGHRYVHLLELVELATRPLILERDPT